LNQHEDLIGLSRYFQLAIGATPPAARRRGSGKYHGVQGMAMLCGKRYASRFPISAR
jgi:hypothetical protein